MDEKSRVAQPGDVPRIVELASEMRTELALLRGGALWLERQAWPEPLDDVYTDLVVRDDAHVAVCTLDDVVLGFGIVVIEHLRSGLPLGVITDLYVEPEARGIGLGDLLSGELLAFAAQRGCIGVDAFALPGARAAKNFFEQHGFTARILTMHHVLDPQ